MRHVLIGTGQKWLSMHLNCINLDLHSINHAYLQVARQRLVELNLISCSFGPTVTSPLSAAESSVLGNGSETTHVFVDWLSRNGNYPALVCGLSLGLGGGTDKKSWGDGHMLANMPCHPPVTAMTTLKCAFDDWPACSIPTRLYLRPVTIVSCVSKFVG